MHFRIEKPCTTEYPILKPIYINVLLVKRYSISCKYNVKDYELSPGFQAASAQSKIIL